VKILSCTLFSYHPLLYIVSKHYYLPYYYYLTLFFCFYYYHHPPGGNKGIGKEIARQIGMDPEFTAMIACRNVELGEAAAEDLRTNNNSEYECDVIALPIPMDLTDLSSIEAASKWVENEYYENDKNGSLDVLINNAAICFNDPTLYGKVSYTAFQHQANITIRTNYFGTLHVVQSFLPLLKKSSSPRIINIASAAGRLSILRSPQLVEAFSSNTLTVIELSNMMEQFVADVESGTHIHKGWPNTCYGMSKLGIIALTRILARSHPEMMINSVDPGYCRTDQNDNQGTVDPSRGAYTPYLLALLERDEEGSNNGEDELVVEADTGLHFYEEKEMPWTYQS
jgi:carbonyl reductase 1